MSVRLDAFIRSLPKAPHVDATQIRGNVSDAEKQLNANVFAYFFTGSGIAPIKHPFGYDIGGRLRIVALNVFDDLENGRAEGEVIYEIEVTKDMCNVYGTLHGGCAALMLDPCTMGAVFVLCSVKGLDSAGGISQNVNIHWHHPAPLGTTLLITTRSVFTDGRTRLARCEMRDKATGKLVVSGTHAFINAGVSAQL
ncbi:HotDog domain-containing protein [Mycena olivaceomarginata]|nr:HotDog domain-containing protein [Mycena olivaceomarginata]KAJ7852372.1 HotDog domain-containing protein [Mycena olivaceomarginata]